MKKQATKKKALAFLLALSFTVSLLSAAAFAETTTETASGTDGAATASAGQTDTAAAAAESAAAPATVSADTAETGDTGAAVTAAESVSAAEAVTAAAPAADTIDLTAQTDALTVTDSGKTLTGSGAATVTLTGGTAAQPLEVTFDNVTITATAGPAVAVTAGSFVTLRFVGTNTLTGAADGIDVPATASATLTGETLTVVGSAGCGIGTSGDTDSGSITVDGFTSLTATGSGAHGAGIGSAHSNVGGIVIRDAAVTATGADGTTKNYEGGPGVGAGGKSCSAGTVTISGSTVTAVGGQQCAGIGSGSRGTCDKITITDSRITATGGSNGGAGIGLSHDSDYGEQRCDLTITISGSTVDAQGGQYGAGIGGQYNNQSQGDYSRKNSESGGSKTHSAVQVNIEDSRVTATGGVNGAGIGGGYKDWNVSVSIDGGSTVRAYAGEPEKQNNGQKIACGIGPGADGSGIFADSTATVSIADGADVQAFSYGYDAAVYNGSTGSGALASKWAVGRELNAGGTDATLLQCRFLTSDFLDENTMTQQFSAMEELDPASDNTVTLTKLGAGSKSYTLPAGYTCFAATVTPGTYTVSLNDELWSFLGSRSYSAVSDLKLSTNTDGDIYSGGTAAGSDYRDYTTSYQPYSGGSDTVTIAYAFGAPSADFAVTAGINSFDAVAYRANVTPTVHQVTYAYTGTVPSAAPSVPDTQTAAGGSSVTVAAAPSLSGYTFSGWTTADAAVSGGSFTMPDSDVQLVGHWTRNSSGGGVIIIPDDPAPQNPSPSASASTSPSVSPSVSPSETPVEITDEPVPAADQPSAAPTAVIPEESVPAAATPAQPAAAAKPKTPTKAKTPATQIGDDPTPTAASPKTGDEAVPLVFAVTAAVSLAGLAALGISEKKRGEHTEK